MAERRTGGLRSVGLFALLASLATTTPRLVVAADHADAPSNANDRAGDLGDVFFFLDPNNNALTVLAMTVQGFIVPAEAANFGFFHRRTLRYRFELETTGDPTPDHFIEVTFNAKKVSPSNPQVGTVRSTFFSSFSGLTTVANLSPTPGPRTITLDPVTGIQFFAGIVDDPFFFDIPAFSRFIASVNAGAPDPTQFNRARDSFAGYNTLAIALEIPTAALRNLLAPGVDEIGLNGVTYRPLDPESAIPPVVDPRRTRVDRAATPAVNVALIPFPRKNEFNRSTPEDDANGRFAGDIVATLKRLGTNDENIGILANVAVANGDYLRLNLSTPNTGPNGGTNAGAGFPNGRRLGDDTIDTILFFVANQQPFGDNVDANELDLTDSFPFFALPHQPFAPGTLDDRTRN